MLFNKSTIRMRQNSRENSIADEAKRSKNVSACNIGTISNKPATAATHLTPISHITSVNQYLSECNFHDSMS